MYRCTDVLILVAKRLQITPKKKIPCTDYKFDSYVLFLQRFYNSRYDFPYDLGIDKDNKTEVLYLAKVGTEYRCLSHDLPINIFFNLESNNLSPSIFFI